MTMKKGMLGAVASLLMAGGMMGASTVSGGQRLEDLDLTPKKAPIPKGMKEFEVNGEMIVALNYKNAVKKYNKMNQ